MVVVVVVVLTFSSHRRGELGAGNKFGLKARVYNIVDDGKGGDGGGGGGGGGGGCCGDGRRVLSRRASILIWGF
jgi:hypothetical protein